MNDLYVASGAVAFVVSCYCAHHAALHENVPVVAAKSIDVPQA